ncbi:MAG: helix-turn-helix domain-containing protein [Acidobacteria bacterium]|nr:helix-turn-helix domain-containing protein [Acidobacteriota bacterium]
MTKSQEILREVDAARFIGMSRAYLRMSRWRGSGPPYLRIGRSIRYRVAALDKWLDTHRVEPSRGGSR